VAKILDLFLILLAIALIWLAVHDNKTVDIDQKQEGIPSISLIKEIQFPRKEFSLNLNQNQIVIRNSTLPADPYKIHTFLENLTTFPDTHQKPTSTPRIEFGFSFKPDILLITEKEKVPLYLGFSVPSMPDSFFLGIGENSQGYTQKVFHQNLSWKLVDFLRTAPIPQNWNSVSFKSSIYKEIQNTVISSTERSIRLTGSNLPLSPYEFLQRGATLFSTPVYPADFKDCTPLFEVNHQNYLNCKQGILNSTLAMGWETNPAQNSWINSWPRAILTRKLKAYLPENISDCDELKFSDGSSIAHTSTSFDFRLKKLLNGPAQILPELESGIPYSIHFYRKNTHISSIHGMLKKNRFITEIAPWAFLAVDLSKVLP
jgi:hypothetical protein